MSSVSILATLSSLPIHSAASQRHVVVYPLSEILLAMRPSLRVRLMECIILRIILRILRIIRRILRLVLHILRMRHGLTFLCSLLLTLPSYPPPASTPSTPSTPNAPLSPPTLPSLTFPHYILAITAFCYAVICSAASSNL